jgi:hypothetical protein
MPKKSELENFIATEVIKSTAAAGSLGIFELTHEKHANKKLLLLAEIETSDKDNESIIERITHELSSAFFNAPTETIEYAFENALAKTNIKIKDILLAKPRNWLQKIHVVVAVLFDEEVHLTSVGSIHAYLVHGEKIVDVLESHEQLTTPNPIKFFTTVVSGTLARGNSLVLTNESVLDYLSPEVIRKNAIEFSSKEATEKLSELLRRAPDSKRFGLAIVSRGRQLHKKIVSDSIKTATQPAQEINIEHVTKNNADEEYPEGPIKKFKREPQELAASTSTLGPKLKQFGLSFLTHFLAFLSKILEYAGRALATLGPKLARFPGFVRSIFSHKGARSYHWSQIKSKLSSIPSKLRTMDYKSLIAGESGKQKIIGALIIVVILGLFGSTFFRAQKRENTFVLEQYSKDLRAIEQKVDEAEAALIYGSTNKTLLLLSEAIKNLDALEENYPNQPQNHEALRVKITTLENKGNKKHVLTDLKSVATIIPEPITANETGLLLAGEDIYFFDGVQEKISSLNAGRGLLLSLPLATEGVSSFHTALSLDETTIATLTNNEVQFIDIGDQTITKQGFEYQPSKAKPFASYAKNLYTFDTEEKSVIRYRRAGAGFTAAQPWLTQDYDLSTIVDIAVDGLIYLLDTQGTIHVFLRGKFNKRIPWSLTSAPGKSLSFYTNDAIDTFYILDSELSRIVRTTKEGELLVQYISPIFEKAHDIIVTADESKLYVLASDKIYEISVE